MAGGRGIGVVTEAARPGSLEVQPLRHLPGKAEAGAFQVVVIERSCAGEVVVAIDGDVAVVDEAGDGEALLKFPAQFQVQQLPFGAPAFVARVGADTGGTAEVELLRGVEVLARQLSGKGLEE